MNKIHINDLDQDLVYVYLDDNFRENFIKKFLLCFSVKKLKALDKASRWLGVKPLAFWRWEKGKRSIQLKKCLKMSELLTKNVNNRFSIKNIEKNIIYYKSKSQNGIIKNPKLPINFETKEGAIVVAALLCDGGINSEGTPLYNNAEECMRERVVNAFNLLFGKIKTDAKKPQQNNAVIFPTVIGHILKNTLKIKFGKKVINDPKIPDLFFNTNKEEIIGAFLNQAFSDDGTAYITKCNNQGTVGFGTAVDVSKFNKKFRNKIKNEKLIRHAPKLVSGCKFLLEKLGIKVNGPYFKYNYKRNNGIAYFWSIQIQGKENLEKFREKVNFSIPKKSKILNEIINNYKEVEYGKSLEDSWKKITEMENEKEKINVRTFMIKRKCTLENARFLFKLLKKEKIIVKKGGGYIKGIHGCLPYEYKILKRFDDKQNE